MTRLCAPAGAGRNVPVYLLLNGMRSDTSASVDYQPHLVTAIHPTSVPVANSDVRITIYGTDFGTRLEPAGPYVDVCSELPEPNELNLGHNVSVGQQACENVTYIDNTSISCFVAPLASAVGFDLDVRVFVNGHSRALPSAFNFSLPSTNTTSPDTVIPSNMKKTNITVTGRNFGLMDFTPDVSIGATFCGITTWVSDSSLICYAARNASHIAPLQGVGDVDVVAHVAGQKTPPTSAVKFKFSPPTVTATQPLDSPGTGRVMVTFFGQNFGLHDYTPTGRIGDKDCLITAWVSDSKVVCQVPRAPDDVADGIVPAAVEVAGVTTNGDETFGFRYMVAPEIISVTPSTAAAAGGAHITITGTGFGTPIETVVARINSVDCSSTHWQSQSSLICVSPAGVGARRSVGVEVTSQSDTSIYSTRMNAFAFKPPVVSNIKRAGSSLWNGPTTGGISMTIIGENFGVTDGENQPQAGVGSINDVGTICSSTAWTSDSSLGCRMDSGIGANLDVWVRIACGAYGGSPRYTCRTTAESTTYGTFS